MLLLLNSVYDLNAQKRLKMDHLLAKACTPWHIKRISLLYSRI